MKAHILVLAVVPLLAAWTAYGQPTTATPTAPPFMEYPSLPRVDPQGSDQGTPAPDGGRAGAGSQRGDPDAYAGYSVDVGGGQIVLQHLPDRALDTTARAPVPAGRLWLHKVPYGVRVIPSRAGQGT